MGTVSISKLPSVRKTFLILFALTLFCLIADAFIQAQAQLKPCSMDFVERITMLLFGFVCLLAALQPQSLTSQKTYAVVCFLLCCLGIYISGYHWWIQSLASTQPHLRLDIPPSQLQNMHFQQIIMAGLSGDQACAAVYWEGGGLTITGWFLLAFVILALSSVFQFMRRKI